MSTRQLTFTAGEFYHVYNRGTDKRTIFSDSSEYERFVQLLYLSNSTKSINVRNVKKTHQNVFEFDRDDVLVSIGAYCLMPNHFHLLVTPSSDMALSTFMNKLGTSYSMFFNKRQERTGSLFEGSFKAKHADTDEYLKYLFAYIHLNPVSLYQPDWKEKGIQDKEKALDFVSDFQYSSLPDYLGVARNEQAILHSAAFPEYFRSCHDHRENLLDWLSFDEQKD